MIWDLDDNKSVNSVKKIADHKLVEMIFQCRKVAVKKIMMYCDNEEEPDEYAESILYHMSEINTENVESFLFSVCAGYSHLIAEAQERKIMVTWGD